MQPFTVHTGIAATLPRVNVDTDQIIPKQFLKRIERTGFGKHLFHDWRYLPDGSPDPAFELNAPNAQGASILVAGPNFGCGSSREHAPWALGDYGFRAVIAPSFADIFRANAIGNSMLPVALPETAVDVILDRSEREQNYSVEVDLDRCEVRDSSGLREPFTIDAASRQRLLEGKDEIDLILTHESDIAAYERRVPTL